MLFLCSVASLSAEKEIRLLSWMTVYEDAYKKIAEQFEKDTGYKVRVEILSQDQCVEKQYMDLTSGTGRYDLFVASYYEIPEYVEAGYAEPIDEYLEGVDLSQWYPEFIDAARYKGKLWSLPMESFGACITYRRDLFEQYGLKPPETTDELWNCAQALTKDLDGDGQNDIYGITMRGKAHSHTTIASAGFPWAYGAYWFEGEAVNADQIRQQKAKPTVNSPEFVEGLKMYVDLLRNFGPPGQANFMWYEMKDAFNAGKVAMYLAHASSPGFTNQPDLPYAEYVDASLPPMGPKRYVQEPYSMNYMVNKLSQNKEAAAKFLLYLTGKDTAQVLADLHFTGIWRKDVNESEEFRKYHNYRTPDGKYVLEESIKLIDWDYLPHTPEVKSLMDIIATATSKSIAGTASTKDALEEANQQILRVMEQAGYYK